MMIRKPAFKENNIPIVFSVDENYAPYLAVCLESLIKASSVNYNYDIWILDGGLTQIAQKKLQELIDGKRNFSLRYFDIRYFNKRKLFTSNHASQANYYRLFIPKIFSKYSKILYLDCDLLINKDVSELYNTDLKGNILGAVLDCCTYFDPEFWYPYCKDKVKIKTHNKYFLNSAKNIFNFA